MQIKLLACHYHEGIEFNCANIEKMIENGGEPCWASPKQGETLTASPEQGETLTASPEQGETLKASPEQGEMSHKTPPSDSATGTVSNKNAVCTGKAIEKVSGVCIRINPENVEAVANELASALPQMDPSLASKIRQILKRVI